MRVRPLLLAAMIGACRDAAPPPPTTPSAVTVVVDRQAPLAWLQRDGDALLWATDLPDQVGSAEVAFALHRIAVTGGPARDLGTIPAGPFVVTPAAYYVVVGPQLRRLDRADLAATTIAVLPAAISGLVVDGTDAFVALRPDVHVDAPSPAEAEAPALGVPQVTASFTGAAIWHVPLDGRAPRALATAEAPGELAVDADAVYWRETMRRDVRSVARRPGGRALPPPPGAITALAVDRDGMVVVAAALDGVAAGQSAPTTLIAVGRAGAAPVTLAQSGQPIFLHGPPDPRWVLAWGDGALRAYPRAGGPPREFGLDATSFGAVVIGDAAFVAVAGPLAGRPTRGIVRVPL